MDDYKFDALFGGMLMVILDILLAVFLVASIECNNVMECKYVWTSAETDTNCKFSNFKY
jgi:hypothetical protein